MSAQFTPAPVVYKDVPGYPGYKVGDDGTVVSFRLRGSGRKMVGEARPLNQQSSSRGYLVVTLSRANRATPHLVHRLVLEAFVGPCPAGKEACHNDGDKTNNRLSNLRWDTKRNNAADRVRHGTHLEGSRVATAKLSPDAVRAIRAGLATGRYGSDLAKEHRVSERAINFIKRGLTWRSVR